MSEEPHAVRQPRRVTSRCIVVRSLAALLAAAGLACNGGGTVGLCFVQYEEPLLTIASASNAATGAAIPQVTVRRFTYDELSSAQLGIEFLTNHVGLTPRNVAIRGNELICSIECAFGAPEGRYGLVFGATGYRDTTVVIDGKYRQGSGNCPTTLSGSVRVTVALTPEQSP